MQSIDLSLLPTLDALLQEGSVSGAARRVGLSTPAMSHALSRLRERVGDPILVRSGRGMVRTPRAEALKERVHTLVQEAAQALSPARPFVAAELQRSFSILASDHVLTVLGLALDRLAHARAPGVSLRFLPNTVDDPGRLRGGEADVAVGIYGDLPPELRTRKLLTDRLVCVVREGHPTVGKRLGLDQFTKLPHLQVAPRAQPGGYVDDVLRARGVERRVARAVPYFLTALHLCARTDYVLTVPERVARAMASQLRLRLLEPPVRLQPYALSLVWHPRFDGDAAHQWMREVLVQAATESAADVHADARVRLTPAEKKRRR